MVGYDGGDAAVTVSDGTDTFIELGDVVNDGGPRTRMFYHQNATGGTGAVTATYDAARTNRSLYVGEWSGLVLTGGTLDFENTPANAFGSGLDAVTTGTLTIAQNAVVIAIAMDQNADTIPIAAGSTMTSRGTGLTFGGANIFARLMDRLRPTTYRNRRRSAEYRSRRIRNMTPNARSKALLESEGFTVEIVERFNPWSHTRHDLFNAFDLLAVGKGATVAVQCTTDSNLAARRTKLAQSKVLPLCLAARWRIEIHGWGKRKNRWRCRRETLEAQVNTG